MLRSAEKAEEPGELAKNRTVFKGDSEVPPMVAQKIESAGYVYIYDTRTGEQSLTNRNMLRTQLGKKRPDGSNVFTVVKPNIVPKRGNLKCMLHTEDPNRGHYDLLGLASCLKSNITSPYQVKRHMQKRHQMEWATIEEERKEAERQEDKAFQRNIMSRVAPEPAKAITYDVATTVTKTEHDCDVCGKSFTTAFALTGHKKSHK